MSDIKEEMAAVESSSLQAESHAEEPKAKTPEKDKASEKAPKKAAPKKARKARPDPSEQDQQLIILLHLVVLKLQNGGSGSINWKWIGENLGSEEVVNPEAVRSRYRSSKDRCMPQLRKGIDALEGAKGEEKKSGKQAKKDPKVVPSKKRKIDDAVLEDEPDDEESAGEVKKSGAKGKKGRKEVKSEE